jgi:uroporphyrinogen decarboxylase
VPYCEFGVDRALAQKLMGWGEPTTHAANLEVNPYTIEEAKALAAHLKLDNIYYVLRAPVYAEKEPGQYGRLFYGRGLIQTEADLALIQLPDPTDDRLYAEAARFAREKGDYAAFFVTRAGPFPTWLSMGLERFCTALYDNRRLVEAVLDRYCDWAVAVAERVCRLGFDVYVTTDDLAFKSGTFFSPAVFRSLFLPRYRRLREKITIPWLVHSDGNIMPFLADFLSLDIAALQPIEKGAMDIRALKRTHGQRVCLMGNVDLNLLGMSTPAEVDEEVRGLIRDVAPGGGYIVSSGNSLASYLLPENVRAMSAAVQKYGRYPINL